MYVYILYIYMYVYYIHIYVYYTILYGQQAGGSHREAGQSSGGY